MFMGLLEICWDGLDAVLIGRNIGGRREARRLKTSRRRRRRWASSQVGRVAGSVMALSRVLVGTPILLTWLRVVSSLPLIAIRMITISHGTYSDGMIPALCYNSGSQYCNISIQWENIQLQIDNLCIKPLVVHAWEVRKVEKRVISVAQHLQKILLL